MFKALIKKQLLEFSAFYLIDRKTGKKRSALGTVCYTGLFVLIFVLLGFFFYMIAKMMVLPFVALNVLWLYFAIMGMMALFMGVFGSVFNTYAGLYLPKDNDFLLSLPIPPFKILLSRMLSVALLSALYGGIVYIPTLIAYFIYSSVTVFSVVTAVISYFILLALIIVITCLIGYLIALLSKILKNKSIITVILSLVFFAAYYYVFANYYSLIGKIIKNALSISEKLRVRAYPLYSFGMAATGNLTFTLILLFVSAVLLVLLLAVLSKSFFKIAASKSSESKAVYNASAAVKVLSKDRALLKKEFSRYIKCPIYILNCSLGTFVMLIVAVAILFLKGRVSDLLKAAPFSKEFITVLAFCICAAATSLNDLTAPSISLEGANLWILRSMPCDAKSIFNAKIKMHCILTMPPAVLLAASLSFVLGLEIADAAFVIASVILFILFFAYIGLVSNLYFPNLVWTSEVIPIKQSMSVLIPIFGSFIASVISAVAGYYAVKHISAFNYLLILFCVLVIGVRLLDSLLSKKGNAIFEALG